MRADICRLRYGSNSTQTGQLFAIGRYMSPPEVSLYNSEERLSLEHNSSMDILAEVQSFLEAHPDYFDVSSDGALSELAMDGGDAQDEATDDGGTSPQGEEENSKDIPYANGLHSVRKHGWGRGNSRTRVYPWLNNLRTLAPSLSPRDKGNEPPKYIDLIFATHWIPMENNASGKNQGHEDKAGRKALLEDIFIPMGQMTVYRVRLHCQCSLSKGKDPNIFECPSFAPFSRQGWPSHMGARGNVCL
ncbi:hypothetical protein J437_LFUL014812 [Ladona fulva]|uniref:Uncharacterized protein n=1 Tax=Ladona fulva TaxID=123851 RepID=A0A8K0PCK7_LADFU|nr:hypothetical protein J437_LFUL014812 [Ladona fulva]